MEVHTSSPVKDSIFNIASHTSSLSAPTSPTRLAGLYRLSNEIAQGEEEEEEEFAFTFEAHQLSSYVSTADELFDDGKIKALKPLFGSRSPAPNSPRKKISQDRGRERDYVAGRSTSRKVSRSFSPHRVSACPWEPGLEEQSVKRNVNSSSVESSSSTHISKSSTKKWSLKDLLLFRSASEGRSTDWDPFRKYSAAALFKTKRLTNDNQEPKSSSFRSSEDSVRKRVPMSAHEVHYTVNKAMSANMKKKTFLPYKYGFLGRLAFNPAIHAPFNNSN